MVADVDRLTTSALNDTADASRMFRPVLSTGATTNFRLPEAIISSSLRSVTKLSLALGNAEIVATPVMKILWFVKLFDANSKAAWYCRSRAWRFAVESVRITVVALPAERFPEAGDIPKDNSSVVLSVVLTEFRCHDNGTPDSPSFTMTSVVLPSAGLAACIKNDLSGTTIWALESHPRSGSCWIPSG